MLELGNIHHAIFDKSDTLAATTIEIVNLVTCSKLYNLDLKNLESCLKLVRKDPSKYQKQDNLDELMKLKEDEDYSEKSQEFLLEVRGEYQTEVFDEVVQNSYNEEESMSLHKFLSGTEALTKKSSKFSSQLEHRSSIGESPVNANYGSKKRRSGFRAFEVHPTENTTQE